MTNRYAGKCTKCETAVTPGEGECVRTGSKWTVTHITCPPTQAERELATRTYLSTQDHCDGCRNTFYRGQLIKVEECWDGPYARLCPDCAAKTWYGAYPVKIAEARNFQPAAGEQQP